MRYRSHKHYGHERGFSCAFRQWRADSHCRLIHGYALAVTLEFGSDKLDERNWVMDFGGLGEVKAFLANLLDHTLLVAEDDPMIMHLGELAKHGLADIRILPAVGCEALAEYIFQSIIHKFALPKGVHLLSVRIDEHGANGASYHWSP